MIVEVHPKNDGSDANPEKIQKTVKTKRHGQNKGNNKKVKT